MICSITIVRYPKWLGWAGLLSMAIFRLPLWLNNNHFWKLMGSGRNGTFDMIPDWRQWAILEVFIDQSNDILYSNTKRQTPTFLTEWWRFFHCEKWTILLEPIEGHGTWDGKKCFGNIPKQSDYEGPIAILTRATIRISKLKHFWSHVDSIAAQMANAPGFITSFGIGEVPLIKQATFSIWESKAQMKMFAYQMQDHAKVIQKTRKENWYQEEMFVRFKMIGSKGKINGINPLDRKL